MEVLCKSYHHLWEYYLAIYNKIIVKKIAKMTLEELREVV